MVAATPGLRTATGHPLHLLNPLPNPLPTHVHPHLPGPTHALAAVHSAGTTAQTPLVFMPAASTHIHACTAPGTPKHLTKTTSTPLPLAPPKPAKLQSTQPQSGPPTYPVLLPLLSTAYEGSKRNLPSPKYYRQNFHDNCSMQIIELPLSCV